MPKKCCIPSCRIQEDDPGGLHLSFFQVPKDETRRAKWASSINNFFKSKIQFKKFAYVCELHFEETSFNIQIMGVRLRLKNQAYPTIFHDVLSFCDTEKEQINETLNAESFGITEDERSQTVSNPPIDNKIESNFKGLLTDIKTEEIDIFDKSKPVFENLHQFEFCTIKTENCEENFSSTKSDELISIENIKTESIDLDDNFQEKNSELDIKTEIFDFPIYKNDVDDFNEKPQTKKNIKIYSRKKSFLAATKKWKPRLGKFYGTCLFCGKIFYHKLLFLNHFYIYHFLVNTEKSVNFRRSKSIQKHSKLKDLQYEICSKLFQCNTKMRKLLKTKSSTQKTKLKLEEPNKTHSGKKSFRCEICFKCYTTSFNLKRHLQTHTGEKPFKCKICSKCFTDSKTFKMHIKTHTNDKPFDCETCLERFSEFSDLKNHIKSHNPKNPFKCEICSKCFTVRSTLNKHIKIHSGEKPFKCTICLKCFTQSNSLKRHIKIHTGEKSFKCEICSKCFAVQSNLKKHIRTHTGEKPFTCDICSKCFTQSSSLKAHIRTHTGENPFKCEFCSKSFTIQSNLKSHIRIHTGENPFKCEYCSKCFTMQSNLKKHIRIHTGEKPFKCKICSKCFTQSNSLKTHIKTHTNDDSLRCEIIQNVFQY